MPPTMAAHCGDVAKNGGRPALPKLPQPITQRKHSQQEDGDERDHDRHRRAHRRRLLRYFAQRAQPGPTPRGGGGVVGLGVGSGLIRVDLPFELGRLSQDDDAVLGHGHEAAVDGDP